MQKLTGILLTALATLLIATCSSGGSNQQQVPMLRSRPPDTARTESSSVRVLPGCIAESPESIELSVSWLDSTQGRIAQVTGRNLQSAKAVYFSLPLPEAELKHAEISGMEWAGEGALSLAVPATPGDLHVGICMLHPRNRQGFTGDTVLAKIRLAGTKDGGSVNRMASGAPANAQSRINLDYDPFTNTFAWYYRNLGDYDQNGEVNIADLTPVAIHFGKNAGGPFAEETIESVVDGDGNGEINIADITPIGIGFGNRQDSFNIYSGSPDKYPVLPTDPSTIAVLQNVPFLASSTLPAEGRLRFEEDNVGPYSPTAGYWLRPVDGSEEGIASEIAGLGNLGPTVVLTASQTLGIAPFSVTLDASGTTDPDGDPLIFYWVVAKEGDPSPTEDDAIKNGPTLQVDLEEGRYMVWVAAIDDDGAMGIDGVALVATAGSVWRTTEVHADLTSYPFSKFLDVGLTALDDDPCFGYAYQTTSGRAVSGLIIGTGLAGENLFSPRSVDFEDVSDSAQVELVADSGTNTVHFFSLFNRPTKAELTHILFDAGGEHISGYAVEPLIDQLKDMSVALKDGRPAVAYHNETDGTLLFRIADNVEGSAWSVETVLDSTGDTGEQTNLVITNNAPAVAYYAPGGLRIRYVNSVMNGDQPAWNLPTTIKALPGAILQDALLTLPGDQRWLLVHDTTAQELVSYGEPNFTTATTIMLTTGNTNDHLSAALIADRACVAWYDRDNTTLWFMRSTNMDGTTWEAPQEVVTGKLVGAISLAEIDGHAAIAWFDGLQQTAHFSVLVE